MKLLVIGPSQSGQFTSPEGRERQAMQASAVERYTIAMPKEGESKLAAAWRMYQESKSQDFDVVTAQDPFFVGFESWCIARAKGARLNVQVHTDINAQSFGKRRLARFVLRRADSIRVVSERIKHQVEQAGTRAPIAVLPIYIDVTRFTSINRHPDGHTVLWIGRFEPEKNPLAAIEVIRKVPKATLVMLGKGSLEKELKRRAAGLSVEFPGWQDPAPYFAHASVVLNTSPAESFGVSIVEALVAGVPVVSMDVGVAKEAGATVVPKEQLATEVSRAVELNLRGQLQMQLLEKQAWVTAWRNSL